jgi:hypothetical protein
LNRITLWSVEFEHDLTGNRYPIFGIVLWEARTGDADRAVAGRHMAGRVYP